VEKFKPGLLKAGRISSLTQNRPTNVTTALPPQISDEFTLQLYPISYSMYGVQYPGQRLQLYSFGMGNMEFSIDDVIISKG